MCTSLPAAELRRLSRAHRAEVERLLAAHDRSGDFILSPAIATARARVGAQTDWAGRLVGPYRVVREIGRGGMGAVYLAERADGQYEHRVALKLIKRGMDTEQACSPAFGPSDKILASLDHPNIARLLDGGDTDQGTPFFAMEYIEGEPDPRLGRSAPTLGGGSACCPSSFSVCPPFICPPARW